MKTRIWLIARNCLTDVVRHKVISIHLIFILIAAGLFNLFGHFSSSAVLEYRMIQDVGISVISLFGLLLTLFIGISTLREELNRKTAYTILTLPISRWEYYLGKFLGTLLATVINITIMVLIFSVLLYLKFQVVWWTFFWIVIFMTMEFAIISSLVLLFSLSDSTTLAFSFTFFLVIVGNLSTYVNHLIQEAEIPAFTYFGKVAFVFIPNFSLFNIKTRILKSLDIPFSLVGWSSAYCLVYIAVAVGLGMYIMEKRDL